MPCKHSHTPIIPKKLKKNQNILITIMIKCTSVLFYLSKLHVLLQYTFFLTVHFSALPYGSWATADQSTAVGYTAGSSRHG